MLTAKVTPPPPPYGAIIGGTGSGPGFVLQAGQYYFHPNPSPNPGEILEIGLSTESATGTVYAVVIDDGWEIKYSSSWDPASGSLSLDPGWDILDTYFVGVYKGTTGGMVSGDRGLASATGQPAPVVGNLLSLSDLGGAPYIEGFGFLP